MISDTKKRSADDDKKEKEAADDVKAGISDPADDAKTEKQLPDDELTDPETGIITEKQPAAAETSVQTDAAQTERDILAGITDKEFSSLSPAEKTAQLDRLRENVHNDLKKQGKALHDMPRDRRNESDPDYRAIRENVRDDILLINALDKQGEPEFRKLFGRQAASLGEIGSDIIDYSGGAIPVDDIIRQNGLGTVIKSGLQMSMKPAADRPDPSPVPSKEPAAVTAPARGKAIGRQ